MKPDVRFALPLLLLAVLLLPVSSKAVTAAGPVKTITYEAAYRQTVPPTGTARYNGTLSLTFNNGILSGWYRDEYEITHHPVVGGYDGSNIWFSIGWRGRNQFTGKVESDGTITGTMSGWRRTLAGTFTATPTK